MIIFSLNGIVMEPSSTDNRPLYNSRIIDTYIKLIKRNYSYINVDELLSFAEMEAYQVKDEGHWFTQKQVNMFYEKLVDEDTIYIKIDDDICWMHEDAIKNLIEFRKNN